MNFESRLSVPPDTDADQETRIGRSDIITMLAMVLAALLIRIFFLRFHDIISTDGTAYVAAARALNNGNIGGIISYGFYPVLVCVANWFVTDSEMAGRLVSVFLSSLMPIPLYLLGQSLFPRQAVIAACLLSIVWPSLLNFSCEVMTQATYTTLVITAVYCTLSMSRSRSIIHGSAAGTCIALAYLTRPEGILLFLVMPLAPLIAQYREIRDTWKTVAAYSGCFLLLFGLNILLIHQATGIWQISAKTSSALNDALSYYLRIPDMNYIPNYRPKGYLDILREYPEFIWINTLINVRQAWLTILPFPLWGLSLIGFLAGGSRSGNNVTRLFLLCTFAPLFVIILFYYINPEYTLPYLPVLFLWAGNGLNFLGTIISRKVQQSGSQGLKVFRSPTIITLAVAAIFSVTLLIRQIPTTPINAYYTPDMDGGRRDCKNLGLLLKKHLPQGKIMTRWARIAFYADREWSNIPKASFDEIINRARQDGVRFLVVDRGLFQYRPELGEDLFGAFGPDAPIQGLFFNIDPDIRTKPGLRPYLFYSDPSSEGMIVFEIMPE